MSPPALMRRLDEMRMLYRLMVHLRAAAPAEPAAVGSTVRP